jgi:hypothetical protein
MSTDAAEEMENLNDSHERNNAKDGNGATKLSIVDDGLDDSTSAGLLQNSIVVRSPTIVDDEPTTTTARGDEESETFKVYPRRWFLLCVVALLNCSNTMSWIAYAPVSNYVDCYYGQSTATWLSLVFLVAAIPVAIVAMWSVRRYGLRSAVSCLFIL